MWYILRQFVYTRIWDKTPLSWNELFIQSSKFHNYQVWLGPRRYSEKILWSYICYYRRNIRSEKHWVRILQWLHTSSLDLEEKTYCSRRDSGCMHQVRLSININNIHLSRSRAIRAVIRGIVSIWRRATCRAWVHEVRHILHPPKARIHHRTKPKPLSPLPI